MNKTRLTYKNFFEIIFTDESDFCFFFAKILFFQLSCAQIVNYILCDMGNGKKQAFIASLNSGTKIN